MIQLENISHIEGGTYGNANISIFHANISISHENILHIEGGTYGGKAFEEALQHPERERLAEGERRKHGWKAQNLFYFLVEICSNIFFVAAQQK